MISMADFEKKAGFGIGDKIAFAFKNVNDGKWVEYEVKEIWGINSVGYSDIDNLCVCVEVFEGKPPTPVKAKDIFQAQAEYKSIQS